MCSCHAFRSVATAQEIGEISGVLQQGLAELVVPSLQSLGGTGDPECRDQLAAAVHRYGDTAEAHLELVDRGRPAAAQASAHVASERLGVGQGGLGPTLERG